MTEAEFETTYRDTLFTIENALEAEIEANDLEIDYETVNDILNLEFGDGSAIIITKQGATQQLWLAAVSGGFHFSYDASSRQWRSTINQQYLAEKLAEACLQQGVTMSFPEL